MTLSNWKFGNFLSVNLGGGMGVTMACYWAWGISGMQTHLYTANTLIDLRSLNKRVCEKYD